jgi:hypothetical protein
MSQLVKVGMIAFIVIFGLGITWLVSQRVLSPEQDAEVQMTRVPPVQGTQAGDPLPPEHEGLRDFFEQHQYERAARAPG